MSLFLDVYLDDQIAGFPCYSSPRFNTTVTRNAGGGERRNRNWAHPLHNFRLPQAIRYHAQFEAIHDHWLITGGREATFPFRDPLDFASCALAEPNVIPDFAGDDQTIGVGDGLTRVFQITKTYSRGGHSYERPIFLPVISSLVLLLDGTIYTDAGQPGGPYTASISRPGGEVTFTPAPAVGLVITWGGLFDTEVRFERDDSFDGIVQSYRVSGFSDLTFEETRRC